VYGDDGKLLAQSGEQTDFMVLGKSNRRDCREGAAPLLVRPEGLVSPSSG